MENHAAIAAPVLIPKTGIRRFWLNFKRNWQLHLMLLIPFLYLLVFHYGPMYGLQIAFKYYRPRLGIEGSEWIGLANLKRVFGYYKWTNLVVNTLALSFYSIFMHVYTGKVLKKVCQNVSYVPHFISLVVMVGILNTVLNPVSGFIGYINKAFGNLAYEDIRGSESAFRHLYVWSGIWQGCGWSSIMYVSALSAVPEDLHEAAKSAPYLERGSAHHYAHHRYHAGAAFWFRYVHRLPEGLPDAELHEYRRFRDHLYLCV